MDQNLQEFSTPGGYPAHKPGNPPSEEAGPMDSGGDHSLFNVSAVSPQTATTEPKCDKRKLPETEILDHHLGRRPVKRPRRQRLQNLPDTTLHLPTTTSSPEAPPTKTTT